MAYRALTKSEIRTYATQLRWHQEWQEYVDYARELYGEKAEQVSPKGDWESDDEGGSYLSIYAIYVYDADGQRLAPDLSLPFWTELIGGLDEKWRKQLDELVAEETDPAELDDSIRELFPDELDEKRSDLPSLEDEDAFYASKPPKLDWPVVYVEVPDAA